MSGQVREFRREACPVCGHKGWCGRREDGLVLCKRPPTPREVLGFVFKGMAKDHATGMYVEAGREFTNGRPKFSGAHHVPPNNARPDGKKVSPEWLGENYQRLVEQFTARRRQELAATLRLPVGAETGLDRAEHLRCRRPAGTPP